MNNTSFEEKIKKKSKMEKKEWQIEVESRRMFSIDEVQQIIECKAVCISGGNGGVVKLYVTINLDGRTISLKGDSNYDGKRETGVKLDFVSVKRLGLNEGEERDIDPVRCVFYNLKNINDGRMVRRVRVLKANSSDILTYVTNSHQNEVTEYIKQHNFGKVTVVENKAHQWGVIDSKGSIIVPYGKYGWIDGFDSGLARVRTHMYPDGRKSLLSMYKWGIINEDGEEVLPLIYDNIWNFLGKNRFSTRVEIKGKASEVYFHDLNPELPIRKSCESHHSDNYDDYGTYYDEYAGSYAQDVMGYSDDVINDAFDGDPDAYWNID